MMGIQHKYIHYINLKLARRITQHKRFVPYGTHPNPSLTLRTSFVREPLYAMCIEFLLDAKYWRNYSGALLYC